MDMSSRVEMARKLVQENEFEVAKQILEKEHQDLEALYLLSLLYRYDDDEYDKERVVIEKSLTLSADQNYMKERLKWHNLPIFDRIVPRKPLHLPRDPDTAPSAEVLENMCFVTGQAQYHWSSSHLFQRCIELSTKAKFVRRWISKKAVSPLIRF